MCTVSVPKREATSIDLPLSLWEDYSSEICIALEDGMTNSESGMGHMEEEIRTRSNDLQRDILERSIQKKADQSPLVCPICETKLKTLKKVERSVLTAFGTIRFSRFRGYCPKCRKWVCPADHVLKLEGRASASPSVQEIAALMVSKMPVSEAQLVIERLTGQRISLATLDREAKRQGKRAGEIESHLNDQVARGTIPPLLNLAPPDSTYTMVIQIDAWNIRERDDWGKSKNLRKKGVEPSRWHWVYGAVVYRIEDGQAQSRQSRPKIQEKLVCMTRGGIDELREKLWSECLRLGIGQAKKVMVLGDGAAWIWNLAQDRFGEAQQRLDYYHASEHLWVVARELYGSDEKQSRRWVKKQQRRLKSNRANKVVEDLQSLRDQWKGTFREVIEREHDYFESHESRMRYQQSEGSLDPIGSGAIESCCRQYQCRFKRTGQFWTKQGDESLLILANTWKNKRWQTLFPHVSPKRLALN